MFSGTAPRVAPATTKPVTLGGIFAQHGDAFRRQHSLPAHHLKVMRRIELCRTAALGGQRQWCEDCGFERYRYHSCRDRHCPQCQTQAREQWRVARQRDLLPVPYFHQVFTLPHEFNEWLLACEANHRALLKLLFASTAETLLALGRGELGGQIGFTLVLHTWDQQLRPHFHLHGLVASGALSDDGSRWIAGGAKMLFPVRALSKMFRGKFIAGFEALRQAGALRLPRGYAAGQRQVGTMLKKVRQKPWVVYCQAPFAGPAKLLDYLSRYTHRVAISNERLVSCVDGQVTFDYRDRADGDRRKRLTIAVERFIGRFLTHVLPERFTRIRHYGFLSTRNRSGKLATIRPLLGADPPSPPPLLTATQWLESVLGIDASRCPCCGGRLHESKCEPLQAAASPTLGSCHRSPSAAGLSLRGPPEAILR